MPPRAVLFDFDGVIADTENVHIVAWERTFGDMGWIVPAEVCERAAEVDDRAFLAQVFSGAGVEGGDVAGWVGRKQELTRRLLGDSPRLYPGVAGLVERLKDSCRLGIVSTTWRENMMAVLNASGLASAFDVIVGKEDVKAVKPDPAGYRLALRRLKVPAKDAVALEDSETGLAAARGAGLRCVIVGHRTPQDGWPAGVPYVADFSDLDAAAEALGLPAGS